MAEKKEEKKDEDKDKPEAKSDAPKLDGVLAPDGILPPAKKDEN